MLREASRYLFLPKRDLQGSVYPSELQRLGFDINDYPDTLGYCVLSVFGYSPNDGHEWRMQARAGANNPLVRLPHFLDAASLGTARLQRDDHSYISAHDAWYGAVDWIRNRKEVETAVVAPEQPIAPDDVHRTDVAGILLVKATKDYLIERQII
jgi:hypothetical protein